MGNTNTLLPFLVIIGVELRFLSIHFAACVLQMIPLKKTRISRCVRNQKRKPHAYERYTRDNSSDSARILVILLRSRTRCSIIEKLSPRSARGHAWSSRILLLARVLPYIRHLSILIFRSTRCAKMLLKLYSRVVHSRNNPSRSQTSIYIHICITWSFRHSTSVAMICYRLYRMIPCSRIVRASAE